MNLTFRYFKDRGSLSKERVVLKVLADDNIGRYALFRSYCRDGTVTTYVSHAFWFPDKEVRAGDFVVLYSKSGEDKERESETGATSHFFYWREDEALWSGDEFAAVVLHAPEWISMLPSA